MKDFSKYLNSMPVMPDISARIISIPEDNLTISFKELEEMIKVDPGLTTKILKVANSAMYARQTEITSLQTAITMLGFRTIKSLVFLVSASNMFKTNDKDDFFKYFWKHSITTAFLARHIAVKGGFKRLSDEAFLAALLHDIGRAAMYQADPELYTALRGIEDERKFFGADHKEVGENVLKNWSFPPVYVDTAREHGSLNITSPHKTIILIVSAADLLSGHFSESPLSETDDEKLDALLLRLSLKPEDRDFYLSSFQEQMQQMPMFRECSSLFGI